MCVREGGRREGWVKEVKEEERKSKDKNKNSDKENKKQE